MFQLLKGVKVELYYVPLIVSFGSQVFELVDFEH
jgi:hypothetical protein